MLKFDNIGLPRPGGGRYRTVEARFEPPAFPTDRWEAEADFAGMQMRPIHSDCGEVLGCMWVGRPDTPIGFASALLDMMGYPRPPQYIHYFPWTLKMIPGDGYRGVIYYIREDYFPCEPLPAA